MEQIKTLGTTPIQFELMEKIKFLDVYQRQTEKCLDSIEENEGVYYFLVEGTSKKGKTTFGLNLHNQFIAKNTNNMALYIELDPKDPYNIFKKLNKCDWSNIEMALDLLLQNRADIWILMIIDNIQHAFQTQQIAAGLLGIFKNMKATRLSFLYISSQNSVFRRMK